jgi:hypothetical protein
MECKTLAVLALILSACASTQKGWQPKGSEADFQADVQDCRLRVIDVKQNHYGTAKANAFYECMYAKGHKVVEYTK